METPDANKANCVCTGSRAYSISVSCERDLKRLHGLEHGFHCNEYILEDGPGIGPPVVLRVAFSMDDPHLLDEGAFSALACTYRHLLVIFSQIAFIHLAV